MAGLEGVSLVLANPFVRIWDGIVGSLPGIIGALLVVFLGWLVGSFLGHLVRKVLERTGIINHVVDRLGLEEEVGKLDLPHFLGLLIKWYIFVVFLTPAAQVAQLTSLAMFLNSAALWIPNVILAIVIALAGYVLAEYVARKIREVKVKRNSLLASSAKALTMMFVVLVVLKQLGIEVSVAENAFLIVLAGLMLGIGLAMGLGLKSEAHDLARELRKRL